MSQSVRRACALASIVGCLLGATVAGQRGGPPPPPASPRVAAPIDLTGYWVSLVTEDWRYRMTLPPKGDFAGVPLNQAGREAAAAWDPARADAIGEKCKAYGAGGVMRMPGRLHVSWSNDDTLKIETDAGAQTRTLSFRNERSESGTWQGASSANWDRSETVMGRGGFFPGPVARGGSLRVVTTNMKPGYLRRNGVPYSAQAVLTEYFDRFDVPNGDTLLVVSSELVDPVYLAQPYWTSTHFKKQSDASGWNPRACE
jgi:hypothetical protein